MRNKCFFFLLLVCPLLFSCNMPKLHTEDQSKTPALLWNFDSFTDRGTAGKAEIQQEKHAEKTPTPQLISGIDFEAAFQQSHSAGDPSYSSVAANGSDSAQWLYFDPGDYSSQSLSTLYVGLRNDGESTWGSDYYLDFYSGNNPSDLSKIALGRSVPSGNDALFEIPIVSADPSWRSCWQLKNSQKEPFYEFCYNHGSGINTSNQQRSAQEETGGSDSGGVFYAFVKTNGSAPEKFSNDELSAEFLSTSPSTGHTFQAYDHSETLTVSFQNNGSQTWDSSYALVFYSGYNWMHANSFSLSGTVDPGGTAVFTLPMEIFEDNDKWVTCWYLSSPDGHNLSDFCFNYYTRS